MAVPLRMSNNNKQGVLSRVKTLINTHAQLQRFYSPQPPKGPLQDHLSPKVESDCSAVEGRHDVSKWETLDASKLGITSSRISRPSQIVLDHLRRRGFKSYLVGGCVRDLILNRTPKDFDVITTAELTEVRKHFRKICRAVIVGRRFPVCLVHVAGSIVEVTSFETEAQTSKGSDQFRRTLLPRCSNKNDLILCKDSLRRDFTINSLFYDPFDNKIYDYANGMADLRSLKLKTVIPAQLSFKEDPGRILRGFRIAARLGLSLSRETAAAILTYSSLVKNFNESKIMIELNYMLSYGAAEPSLRLLWKFNLLEFLLPVHAAYLDQQANKEDDLTSSMLMKLFLHLDNLVACDRPSDCTLWIGLLAFQLALVKNPQDALVVWAFASVLYHGEWKEGIKFAKERAEMCVNFAPEITRSSLCKSDEQIAKAVTNLASLVMKSIPVLVQKNCLLQSLSRYPSFPQSGMVFVPRKTGRLVSQIFDVLVNDVQSYRRGRKSSTINYSLLGQGDLTETRYVFGKIVLDTMTSGIVEDKKDFEVERCHAKTESTKETGQLQLTDPVNHQSVAGKHKEQVLSPPNPERKQEKMKKRKLVEVECVAEQKTSEEHQKRVKLSGKVNSSTAKDSLPKTKNFQSKQQMNDRRKTTIVSKSSSAQARQLKMDEHNRRTSSRSMTKGSVPKKEKCQREQLIKDRHLKMEEHNKRTSSQPTVSKNHQEVADNCVMNVDANTTNKSDLQKEKLHLSPDEDLKDKERQQPHKHKPSMPRLSSLFN